MDSIEDKLYMNNQMSDTCSGEPLVKLQKNLVEW